MNPIVAAYLALKAMRAEMKAKAKEEKRKDTKENEMRFSGYSSHHVRQAPFSPKRHAQGHKARKKHKLKLRAKLKAKRFKGRSA